MIKKSNYQIKCGTDGNFNLFNATGEMLFLKNNGIPFLPVTNLAVIWGEPKMSVSDDKIIYAMADNSLYEAPQTVLELHDDHIEFYFKAKVKQRMALNKWYLIQKDSEINALECLDFRSHIDSPAAYKLHQTVLGRRKLGTIGLDANTEDGDLMFAPHPMLFVFRHLADSMVIAPTELGIPMIYNILRFNGDGHVYTNDDYAKLKGILDNYVEKTPKLKNYMASL